MQRIRGPFVEYECAKCGHTVQRQINARRAVKELDELRDERGLVCAGCWAGLDEQNQS